MQSERRGELETGGLGGGDAPQAGLLRDRHQGVKSRGFGGTPPKASPQTRDLRTNNNPWLKSVSAFARPEFNAEPIHFYIFSQPCHRPPTQELIDDALHRTARSKLASQMQNDS